MLLLIILSVAFWIRIQGVDTIPNGQFTSNDAYFYYRQAQTVSDIGHLPARDMDRWLPVGRDNRQILPLYAYVVAYTHKAVTLFAPNTSLYHVMFYLPTCCFVIGLGFLCLYLYRVFGLLFSATVGVLMATMPSTIVRSAAGFSDRDSWCILLGVVAIITYLIAMRMQYTRKKMIYTLASGVTCFLGGHSWEGFGVFVSVILFVEICQFLTAETEEDLKYYFLWVLTFVPTLFFTSHPYRRGEWFAQHLFAFMLVPPIILLLIRCIRYYLTTKSFLAEKLRSHRKTLALVLTLISFSIGIFYTLCQMDTFSLTTVPLGNNHLMESVSELNSPIYGHWVFGFGSIFFLGCVGLIVTSIHLWNKKSFVFTFSLVLFSASTFFRDQIDNLWGMSVNNVLFFLSIAGAVFGLLLIVWLHKTQDQHGIFFIAFAIWFLYWIALSRDAIRYQYFIGIPITFFTAALFRYILDSICVKLNVRGALQIFIKTGITATLLTVLLFWTPAGAHAKSSIFTVKHGMPAIPGNTPLEKTFRWMKSNLGNTTCVAANWSYGSQLNVLGDVKTIIDQDHYIQHWIHLFYRHVYTAQSDIESLEFLKTHEATHLMLTTDDMLQLDYIHSSVSNDPKNKQAFQVAPLQVKRYENRRPYLIPVFHDTPFTHIDIDQTQDNLLIATTAKLKDGGTLEISNIFFRDKRRMVSNNNPGVDNGGILLFFDSKKQTFKGHYISSKSWNSLAVRLFFRGESSETFVPVYPADRDVAAEVKVWEIRYPPDIKSDPKYLATEPSE